MDLTRVQTPAGPRWAVDGIFLLPGFSLETLLAKDFDQIGPYLQDQKSGQSAGGALLAPVEPSQELWASGVTYLRSRKARETESATADIYQRVYQAHRPELFFKAIGWRVVGPNGLIHVRKDSRWSVPEPELVLVINHQGAIWGYTAGNDVSSRDIEGENPLYLPQAKVYNGSCAVGPSIRLVEDPESLKTMDIGLEIERGNAPVFLGATSTSLMVRDFMGLSSHLFNEMDFPRGVFLFTGTGIVPPEEFTLQPGDWVTVRVGDLELKNQTD
jgi:2-dehydro-3-deoxy-D-arabinonate dehydratase